MSGSLPNQQTGKKKKVFYLICSLKMVQTKSTEKKKAQAQAKLQEEERHIGLVILPYIPGKTERLKRVSKNHQIKVATKPLRNLGNMQPSLQDKINKFDQRSVVYKIPCLGCTGVYIDETGRSFKTRRKERQT